jgi:hypothetical protein
MSRCSLSWSRYSWKFLGMFVYSMAILLFIPGLTVSLFLLHHLKFVKCRQGLLFCRAALVKSCGLRFIIPLKYLKIGNTELCIHGSFWCVLSTVDQVTAFTKIYPYPLHTGNVHHLAKSSQCSSASDLLVYLEWMRRAKFFGFGLWGCEVDEAWLLWSNNSGSGSVVLNWNGDCPE